jgi:hypothetical protein
MLIEGGPPEPTAGQQQVNTSNGVFPLNPSSDPALQRNGADCGRRGDWSRSSQHFHLDGRRSSNRDGVRDVPVERRISVIPEINEWMTEDKPGVSPRQSRTGAGESSHQNLEPRPNKSGDLVCDHGHETSHCSNDFHDNDLHDNDLLEMFFPRKQFCCLARPATGRGK